MVDIFVNYFLEDTLKNLTRSSKLDEKIQVVSFTKDIKYLRGFLKIAEKKRDKHPEVMDLMMRIRNEISKIEDIVELYGVFKAEHSSLEHHVHLSLDLDSLKKEIKTLKAEAEHILGKNMYDINGVAGKTFKLRSTRSEGVGKHSTMSGCSSSSGLIHTFKVGEEKVVVGFEHEVRTLMEKLGDSVGGELEIISIIGTRGAGKTTLAKEVYDNPLTLQRFHVRAWVHVSQDYNYTMKKDILITILESVNAGYHEDYRELSEDYLGEMLLKCLKGKKYLIVMDDIWDPKAWFDIQRSFPVERTKGKLLLTSRIPVELDGRVLHVYHWLKLLSDSCSWKLFQEQVFKKKQCPPELVDIGMQIAQRCYGLPVSIIAIASILEKEDKTIDVWEEVAEHLSSIMVNKENGIMEILELSYHHLPSHLKACFLYIGAYPEHKEISVRELIWLWIAERFVRQNGGDKRLEDIAKDYLTNLIERNLIMVARKGTLGTIKACYIHDLQRQLCLKIAQEEQFFKRIYGDESSSPFAINEHCRLFCDTRFFRFSSIPYARNLRSFLCPSLPNNKAVVDEENLSFPVEKFKCLRVLHFISGTIVEISKGDLVHLRYLAISLPGAQNHLALKFFCYLLNLEILNLEARWDNILLPHDIFKMVKLRHLYTKSGTFTYHHNSHVEGEENMLDSLQSLQRMGICEHCLRFLKRTPNLRKLKLSGHLCGELNGALILPDLEFLESLEILSLSGRDLGAGEAITSLKLPTTLTKLTLKKTHLEWEKLSKILQTLQSLEVLKLLSDACSGRIWDTSELDEEISPLKYLRLQLLDIEEWSASEGQFPGLEVLVIQHCYTLKGIPIAFSDCNELHEITVEYCRPSTEESAWKILEGMRNIKGDDDCLKVFTRDNFQDCAICLERYADTDDVEELPCSHIFHTECVGEWLETSTVCPLCKSEIYVDTYDVDSDNPDADDVDTDAVHSDADEVEQLP